MYRLSPDHSALTDEKRKRYEDAVRWLRDVSKGVASLGASEELEDVPDEPEITEQDRLFTRGTLENLF